MTACDMKAGNLIASVVAVVFLTAFGGFWWSVVGMIDRGIGRESLQQWQAAQFPATTGTVTQSDVSVYHGSKSTSYDWNLRYRYNVGGEELTGSRYRYTSTTYKGHPAYVSQNAGRTQQLAEQYPVGSTVQAFYNPRDPHDVLLAPGLNGENVMSVLFITPFNIVALGLAMLIVSTVRTLFLSPVAGGVRLIRDGFRTRVRLPVFMPVPLGLLVTGGVSFLSIFALAIPYQFEPPVMLATAVLAGAFAAGVIAALVQWRKIAAGKDDLVIDEGAATLQLPLTYGRKELRTVSFADVGQVRVETIVSTNSKGGTTYRYEPTLYLRHDGAKGERLASWNALARADSFAAWLRERLRMSREA